MAAIRARLPALGLCEELGLCVEAILRAERTRRVTS